MGRKASPAIDARKATSLNAVAGEMALTLAVGSVLAPQPQTAPISGAIAATHLRGVIAAILNQFLADRTGRLKQSKSSISEVSQRRLRFESASCGSRPAR